MRTSSTSTPSGKGRPDEDDNGYPAFEALIAKRVAEGTCQGPVFQTDAKHLFNEYLDNLPAEYRQHYRCHSCRRFFERYAGLTTIDYPTSTDHSPLLWCGYTMPPFFRKAARELWDCVSNARITGVFLSADTVWGEPVSLKHTEWTHLHGTNSKPYKGVLLTAEQAMAEKREDYGMLRRALAEIPIEAAVQAVRVLEADVLDRSEKTLGVAKWFLELHQRVKAQRSSKAKDNVCWLAVAQAPPGWCHVKTTMISTLLQDIVDGMSFEVIQARWKEKMHPLQYQRPTGVKAGTLTQANAVVEKLGSAGSLKRRFARLSDVLKFEWKPRRSKEEKLQDWAGAFGHILPTKGQVKPPKVQPVQLPPTKIAWKKFRDTVLPKARKLEVMLPSHGSYYGLVTAEVSDAPPILQWDGLADEPRNPCSWYLYMNGSTAQAWNLRASEWTQVNGVFLKPPFWQKPDLFKHQGDGVFFALQGAKDLNHRGSGGFFPELLKAEYHGIRAAMEAYAMNASVSRKEEGNANGIALQPGHNTLHVRVNGDTEYILS